MQNGNKMWRRPNCEEQTVEKTVQHPGAVDATHFVFSTTTTTRNANNKSPTPNTYHLEGSGWSDENMGSSSDHIDPRGNIVCAVVATTGGGRCSIKQRERAKQEMEN